MTASRPHVVRQGECFASVAARYGSTVEALTEDARNRALVEARGNPYILAPGDIIWVPEQRDGDRVNFRAGQTNRYSAHRPTTELLLDVRDAAGHPLGGRRFRLECGGSPIFGVTTSSGRLAAEVPANIVSLHVIVELEENPREAAAAHDDDDGDTSTFPEHARRAPRVVDDAEPRGRTGVFMVLMGHLDPIERMSGVQARLENLGHVCPVTGTLDDRTRAALEAFQSRERLPVTGAVDEATSTALLRVHGV